MILKLKVEVASGGAVDVGVLIGPNLGGTMAQAGSLRFSIEEFVLLVATLRGGVGSKDATYFDRLGVVLEMGDGVFNLKEMTR